MAVFRIEWGFARELEGDFAAVAGAVVDGVEVVVRVGLVGGAKLPLVELVVGGFGVRGGGVDFLLVGGAAVGGGVVGGVFGGHGSGREGEGER